MLWGSVFFTYFAVFDDARGIFHPYYTVVIAPAVAALAGAGTVALWRLGQASLRWAWVLPAAIVGSVLWADALLARTSGYDPWLRPTVIITGIAAALVLFLFMTRRLRVRWFAVAAGVMAVASVLAGALAYSLTTVGNVTRPPAIAGPGGGDSLLGVSSQAVVNQGLVDYVEDHQGSAAYLAAATGSETAAQFILLSGKPVVAIGGYTGWDPAPTLRAFKHLVASGMVHYVYASGVTEEAKAGNTATATVDEWLKDHGRVVSPSAYGAKSGAWTLYHVSDSTAPGSRRPRPLR